MQLTDIVELLANLEHEMKLDKKISSACKGKIVFGTKFSYSEISWKGIKTLEELVAIKGGVLILQKAYNKAKAEKGNVFNDVKRLEKLGILI